MILGLAALAMTVASRPPNFVVIYCDDLGYGDLSCYGNRAYKTPNLDRMAREGTRFTSFYVASPACSPSRAALMTGCYPVRVSVPEVLGPDSKTGLNPEEANIASILRPLGYTTACVGKWHLGVKNLLPTRQGFDTFYGLPYSHDMWPPNRNAWPPLWLYRDEKPIEEVRTLGDAAQLTAKYTRAATEFIRANRGRPFFLYLPHSMPHVPLAASERFLGKSGAGLYGDVIREIDWSVGEILKALRQNGLDKDTLVVFSSDNGPWRPYGDHAGSPGGLREGKGTTFEAGFRVPGIFRWPGKVPAGAVCDEVASTMDLLPTFAALAGAKLPEAKIDGHDIRPLISGEPGAKTPWKWFYYYWPDQLQAVRSGDWKLHVPHKHRHQTEPAGRDGKSAGEVTQEIELSLFDLSKDPTETTNVADRHPEVVQRLLRMIAIGRKELGDSITKTKGAEVRPPGKVEG